MEVSGIRFKYKYILSRIRQESRSCVSPPEAMREYFNPNSIWWHLIDTHTSGQIVGSLKYFISVFSETIFGERALISGDYVRDVWPESSEWWNLTREIVRESGRYFCAWPLVSQGTNDAAAPGAGAETKISWIRLMAGPFGCTSQFPPRRNNGALI